MPQVVRLVGRAAWRASNLTRKQLRHLALRCRSAGRRLMAFKPLVRGWRRFERRRERQAEVRFERRVERSACARAASGRPIIVGPWISEVGFEALYWVPYLRWLKAECNWEAARAIAISRGGVASWYRGLADHYLDVFDHLSPEAFAARNRLRQDAGDHKQLSRSTLDDELIAIARARPGFEDAVVVHPSDMYQLFRFYWLGHRGASYVQERTRAAPQPPPGRFSLDSLPRDYIAVKAYTARSLPDTGGNRALLSAIVAALAEQIDVVLLQTGLAIDDHADYSIDADRRVHPLGPLLTPANNLELQTEVIARSRGFVGTCGGLAWLAPMLNVPTVALFSDARFLHAHLYFARKIYLEMDAAPFATVDLGAAGVIGLEMSSEIARLALRG
jgi:hypothetical protein